MIGCTGINEDEHFWFILSTYTKNNGIFAMSTAVYSHPLNIMSLVCGFIKTGTWGVVRDCNNGRGWDCSTLAIKLVINAEVWGSSLFAISIAFAVGFQLKPSCLVLMAMPLNPPLFPNPGGNCPSFPPPRQ